MKKTFFIFFISLMNFILSTSSQAQERAQEYENAGKYDLALEELNKAIEKNSYRVEYYLSGARVYAKQKKYDKALVVCDNIKNRFSLDFNTNNEMGLIYDRMRMYDLAIYHYNAALKYDNKNQNVYNNRANSYSRKGATDSAFADYAKAISLDQGFANPFSSRGRTYFALGDYDKAVTDLKKAISLRRDYDYAYLNLVFPLSRLHLFSEAASIYSIYNRLNSTDTLDYPGWNYAIYYIKAVSESIPDNNFEKALGQLRKAEQLCILQEEKRNAIETSWYASILALKGYVLEKLNRESEALEAYQLSIGIQPGQSDIRDAITRLGKKSEPTNITKIIPKASEEDLREADAFYERGEEKYWQKDYSNAIENYTKAIEIKPREIKYYSSRALAKRLMDDHKGAAADYSKIIEINPLDADAYKSRGDLKAYSLKDHTGAIADYRKAISLDPKLAVSVYKDIAFVEKYFLKDFQAALADYDKLIAIAPKDADAYSYRADVKAELKDYPGALADYNKSISIDPKNDMAYSSRADFKADQKDWIGAIDDLKKAAELDPEETRYHLDIAGIRTIGFKDYQGAMDAIGNAISIDSKKSFIYNNRGMVNEYFGKYSDAVKDFEKAIDLDKTDASNYIEIIKPFAQLRKFTQAAAYYNTYQNLGLKSYSLEDSTGAYLKKYIEAITNGIVKNDFNTALINLQQAEILCNKQETDKIIDELNKMDLGLILSLKGYVLEKLNRNAEARDVYKQVLVINASQTDVIQALADLEKKISANIQQDKTPPSIELINPQPSRSFDIVSDNENTTVVGRAKDLSGIASVKINNASVSRLDEDGLFIADIVLKPGANEISIIATDKQGNTASKVFTLTGTMTAKKKSDDPLIPIIANQPPKYYALLIAEQDYQDRDIKDLENPLKDATELKKILEKYYTFDAANIETLFNRSREEIMQALVKRCNSLTDNDNLIIFYAGHGIAVKDKFGDMDGYLLPVDSKKGITTSYISASEINIALKPSNAKHILFIADACFSGALLRSNRGLPDEANWGIQKQYKMSSRKAMTSGNMEEVPDNSKFIYYLMKSLRENTEKYVSAKDVFNSFYDAINNNTATLPQYGAIMNVGDEGGEFIFIKK